MSELAERYLRRDGAEVTTTSTNEVSAAKPGACC
jgi:hypothetical protein